MNEGNLRKVLAEAQEKGQVGIFIWSSWTLWDDAGLEVVEGDKAYDFAVEALKQQRETNISGNMIGLNMPLFLSIPIKKIEGNEEFFSRVLEACEEMNLKGPVTLIPLNELSEIMLE